MTDNDNVHGFGHVRAIVRNIDDVEIGRVDIDGDLSIDPFGSESIQVVVNIVVWPHNAHSIEKTLTFNLKTDAMGDNDEDTDTEIAYITSYNR